MQLDIYATVFLSIHYACKLNMFYFHVLCHSNDD